MKISYKKEKKTLYRLMYLLLPPAKNKKQKNVVKYSADQP